MRIFTLGKNGIPLFFFALFLLTGTNSSYGQESCPTVDGNDSIQYFCDPQGADVGALDVTTGTNVLWYESQTSTTPLSSTNLLVSGRKYYAGTSEGGCQNQRAEVTVEILNTPEILGIKASVAPLTSANRRQSLAVIGVCVADVNSPGLYIEDLRTNVDDETQIKWYYSRSDETAIPAGTELQNNTDYFAAFVAPDGSCETNRRKTTVRFFSEEAPEATPEQSFCAIDDPTIADIEASGNNRYFATATTQTELNPNDLLAVSYTHLTLPTKRIV